MPRYYFHLTDGKQLLNNHKGIDLPGNAAVCQIAGFADRRSNSTNRPAASSFLLTTGGTFGRQTRLRVFSGTLDHAASQASSASLPVTAFRAALSISRNSFAGPTLFANREASTCRAFSMYMCQRMSVASRSIPTGSASPFRRRSASISRLCLGEV